MGLKNSDEFFEGYLVLRGSICFIYEKILLGDRVPLKEQTFGVMFSRAFIFSGF